MAAQRIEVVISAQDDYTATMNRFNSALTATEGAVKSVAGTTMSWIEFLKGRMGPAMKEFGNHTDAVRHLSDEYKKYKATGVAAHTAVDTAAERSTSVIAGLRAAAAQLAAVYYASRWLIDAGKDALEAEIHYNKLRVQVEGLGISFKTVEPQIQSAITASSRYARVQENETSKALQEMIFHSGNYGESLRRLNLTLDLAYQKGISTSEAAMIMGRAISGNTALLTRFLPELSNLDEKLGKYATESERVAFVMAVLQEKTNGASSEMTEHEKKVRNVTNAYKDVKQAVGEFLLFSADKFVNDLRKPGEAFDWLAEKINRTAAAINPNIVTKEQAGALNEHKKAIEGVGAAHEKTAAQIAAEAKAESDAEEARLERLKALKVPEKHGGSLMALVWGDLDVPALGEKAELAGIEIGGKLAAGFAAAQEEREVDPFAADFADELTYDASKYKARLISEEEFNEAYFSLLDERYSKDMEIEEKRLDGRRLSTDEELQIIQDTEQQILNLKFSAANQAVALLSVLGQKNKSVAIAAIALQKGLAMAQVWIQTITAASGARAALSMIPIVGPALAEAEYNRIMFMGKLNLALIAATGLAELAMGGGGSSPSGIGGGGGVGALPITAPSVAQQTEQRPQIIFKVERIELLDEDSVDRLMARIKERSEDYDVQFVGSVSA